MKVQTSIHSGTATYTTASGDSLASIAQTFYGSNATYDQVLGIWKANWMKVSNDIYAPILPGTVLTIP
jgi:nucleoid-associated protein YgaU